MLSAFGEYTKSLRKAHGESLRIMAEKLEISPAYLSVMENGRRTATKEIVSKVCGIYNLNATESSKLQDLANIANQYVDIEISEMNKAQQEVSLIFARRIKDADPDLVEKLKKVLEEND